MQRFSSRRPIVTKKSSFFRPKSYKRCYFIRSKYKRSKKEMQVKNKAIKVVLKENFTNFLAQAIIKTILTPYLGLKTFLTLFILASTVLTSYLVIQSLITYLGYGVTTTSRHVFETKALFPKVKFCNVNPFTSEYAYRLTQMGIFNSKNLTTKLRKKLAHDLSDILLECKFNDKFCNSTEFTWSFHHSYGNCYKFNTGLDSNGKRINLKQSNLVGPKFGLQMTLYVNHYEMLNNYVSYGLGGLIQIGNSSYSTFYSNSGIFVSPGTIVYISMNREFKTMLPKPYSNCEIDSNTPKYIHGREFYNLIANSTYEYTQQLCISQCIQKHYIEKYNCTLDFLLSLYHKSQCSSDLDSIFDGNFINDVCTPMCPLECSRIKYKTSISFNQLNGNSYISLIKKNPRLSSDFINRILDATQAEKSIVKVNIFYESLSYTHSTESPQMDMVSLLANIGGNMGLFLGVSVFTLAEIVNVLIEVYFILRNNIYKR
jgi:hypothetical protein